MECLLRTAVFGAALMVGVVGAWTIWQSFHDYSALSLFLFAFAILFVSMAYIVKRRKLGMLETRSSDAL
jgi:hypothetical protein